VGSLGSAGRLAAPGPGTEAPAGRDPELGSAVSRVIRTFFGFLPAWRSHTLADVELRPYTDADVWLTEELETDPDVMSELGGPQSADSIPVTHARRLDNVEAGNLWLVIEPQPGVAAGTIGVWPTTENGVEMFEVGWMVLPRFQRQGIASRALALLIDRCRAETRIDTIHAFPGVPNAASNALCRNAGFRWIGELDVLYGDRSLRVNHWERSTA
jgi:RimJ/RimL family protein N-acetyltransferase